MEDAVAVVIVDNEEILVASRRAMRKSTSQVMIGSVFSNKGDNKGSARIEGFDIRAVRQWKNVSSSGFSSFDGRRVDCRFFRSWFRWPLVEATLFGRCASIESELIPGLVMKLPFLIAFFHVETTGLPQQP
jgi:hypothetical protein